MKIKSSAIRRANKDIKRILVKIIDTKRRSSDGHTIQKRTGNLRKNIKPLIDIEGSELVVDIQVMEYYQYLDEGTRRIKPWFLTEELFDNEEFQTILQNLVAEGIEGSIVDVVSKFKK